MERIAEVTYIWKRHIYIGHKNILYLIFFRHK